jgi:hypothetical protein
MVGQEHHRPSFAMRRTNAAVYTVSATLVCLVAVIMPFVGRYSHTRPNVSRKMPVKIELTVLGLVGPLSIPSPLSSDWFRSVNGIKVSMKDVLWEVYHLEKWTEVHFQSVL